MPGVVLRIYLAAEAGGHMWPTEQAEAIQGQGLVHDRYAKGQGTWSRVKRPGVVRHVSLIEVEALEAANSELEQPFFPDDTRRNILTRGVSLNALVGREFLIGEVRVRGVELCDPCERPSKLSRKPGFAQAFAGRGGLRVEVLTSGVIRPGDTIVL